jgi:hypothetical protein
MSTSGQRMPIVSFDVERLRRFYAEAAAADKPAMPADRRRRLMSVVNGAS